MKFALFASVLAAALFAHGEDNFPVRYEPSQARPLSCRNGKIEIVTVTIDEHSDRIPYICVKGRFVPAFSEVPPVHDGIATCRNGEIEIFRVGKDSSVPTYFVCKRGVFVQK